jgi:hypothetical protein
MGIRDLKPHLPYEDVNIYAVGQAFVIDVANLLYLAQLRHAEAAFTDDDLPGLAEMRKMLEVMQHNKLDLELIFNGQSALYQARPCTKPTAPRS